MRQGRAPLIIVVACGLAYGLVACNYVIGYDKLRKVNRQIALQPDGALVFVAATEVKLGARHTCATFADGSLRCWGSNDFGQLGVGGTEHQLVPVVVPDVDDVASLSLGDNHTCVTRRSGETSCFGAKEGQLVDDTTPPPEREHACELRDGAVYCSGRNDSGQLGLGDLVDRATPTKITF